MIDISHSNESNLNEILALHEVAFGVKEDEEVRGLVADLLKDPTAEPLMSLIAKSSSVIAGHILFTHAQLQNSAQQTDIVILAPLGVLPDYQNQRVGSLLVKEGLTQLTSRGVELVFVVGHEDYYPRFGFTPAQRLGFEPTYPIAEKDTGAWMVIELVEGAIQKAGGGRVQCAEALDKPEYWRETV